MSILFCKLTYKNARLLLRSFGILEIDLWPGPYVRTGVCVTDLLELYICRRLQVGLRS
jgi:hypothetical protein